MLESVIEVDLVLPTTTLPKFTEDALTDRLPVGVRFDVDVPAILVPAHPTVNRTFSIRKIVK